MRLHGAGRHVAKDAGKVCFLRLLRFSGQFASTGDDILITELELDRVVPTGLAFSAARASLVARWLLGAFIARDGTYIIR